MTTPTNISVDREARMMTITWRDGRKTHYPFAFLRNACPCAACQDERRKEAENPTEGLLNLPVIDPRKTMIRRVELVGNYALTIEWEDGHHFGIYNWEYLRKLAEQLNDQVHNGP